jgi:hypothetical protein
MLEYTNEMDPLRKEIMRMYLARTADTLDPINAHPIALIVCCHDEDGNGERVELLTLGHDPLIQELRKLLAMNSDSEHKKI